MPRVTRQTAAGTFDAPAKAEETTWVSLRPNLYLDIIGTLVLQEGTRYRLAPFAKEFIATIKESFDLKFLSELTSAAATEIAELLEADIEFIPWRKGLGKVTGIDFAKDFLWIDDSPAPRDLMRLSEERCSSSLISVNGRDGVTRVTLDKVEASLERLALV